MCEVLLSKPIMVATFNCRGVFAKPKGARHPRVVDLLTSFTKTRIDMLGLQEPHLRVSAGGKDQQRLQGLCGRYGLHSLVNAAPTGFGGTGLVWSDDWEVCWAASLEPLIMFATLVSGDGLRLTVPSAHFNDKAAERLRQWEAVGRFVQQHALTIHMSISDHNSLIVPGVDSHTVPKSGETAETLLARQVEVATLANWKLTDVWPVVHPPSPEVRVPSGWTWGFPSAEDNPSQPISVPLTGPLDCVSADGGGGAAAPLLGRIDRVCVRPELVSDMAGAYPAFLSKSDHKCLVLSIAPQARPGVATRERIPTSFLSDDTLVSNLETRLRSQVTTGLGCWEDAHAKKCEVAWRFERTHRPCSFLEAAAYLRYCTRQRVSAEARAFLGYKGFHPATDDAAYSHLVAPSEREQQDRTGMQVPESRKEAPSSESSPKSRRKAEINRVVRKLQNRRRLCVLRERGGHLLTDPLKMAKALSGYWGVVMTDKGVSVSDCKAFLHRLGLPKQWRGVAPKLIRTLSEEVVLTALERMHATSSPGLDGVSAAVYQRMPLVPVFQMLHMVRAMCSSGVVPEAWSFAIMNCIPKRPGIPEVSALWPICLQNSVFKWFTGTLLLLLEDLISFVTPREQKAFLKGRSILDHIWGSRGAWDHYTVEAFLTVDFAKASDSVQHSYMVAVLEYLGVDQALITLLIQLFRAPFIFAVGRGVVREEKVYPRSGVRQGDPLSLALFVLFCSLLIGQL